MRKSTRSLLLPVALCALWLPRPAEALGKSSTETLFLPSGGSGPTNTDPRTGSNRTEPDTGRLSRAEQSLVDDIDSREGEAMALLERLVNVNSGTENLAGVRQAGQMLQGEFEALGFETRWVDGRPFGRAGHLIAERVGPAGGPKVLLIGHLDTVFSPDSPFRDFERLSGNRARGPGVIDMKGGDVVMLYALKALQAGGALDRLHLVVVLSGDEEDPGSPLDLARRDLIAAGSGALVALGFEDGDGDPTTAVIARRGSLDWHLEVNGKPAHSSQIFQPDVGAGAVFASARILDGFYRRLSKEPDLTLSPGLLLGGTDVTLDGDSSRGTVFGKTNVVAGRAFVAGDLRTLSPEQLLMAKSAMSEIAADCLPGTEAQLSFGDGYPPMAPTAGNRRLLGLLDQASHDLGLGRVNAVDPRNAGAADVSFIASEVPMVLDGLGLMGAGGHTVQETADLSTLPTQTAKAALLLYRIAQGALSEGQ